MAGVVALRGFIASQLYGVGALDPLVIFVVTSALAIAQRLPASARPAAPPASIRSSRWRSDNQGRGSGTHPQEGGLWPWCEALWRTRRSLGGGGQPRRRITPATVL